MSEEKKKTAREIIEGYDGPPVRIMEVCDDPAEGEYMSTTAIFQRIKQVAGSSLGVSGITKFGQFLTNIDGIVRKRTNLGTVYLVKQKL